MPKTSSKDLSIELKNISPANGVGQAIRRLAYKPVRGDLEQHRTGGSTEVSNFAYRKRAVARVWKANQPFASDGHASQPEAGKRKGARQRAKEAKTAKEARQLKKAALKPKADRTNKKADLIAMMQRAKGGTVAEIMETTGWQAHS